MRTKQIVLFAAGIVLLVAIAVACGHVSPKGSVREELRQDMDEYQEWTDAQITGLETTKDLADFKNSCWSSGCLGEACMGIRLNCAKSDLQKMSEADTRMEQIQSRWEHADLTPDERAYFDEVIENSNKKLLAFTLSAVGEEKCGACGSCSGGLAWCM